MQGQLRGFKRYKVESCASPASVTQCVRHGTSVLPHVGFKLVTPRGACLELDTKHVHHYVLEFSRLEENNQLSICTLLFTLETGAIERNCYRLSNKVTIYLA